ncbi:MAG: DUF2169 domain-containing protein [Phycisphaera sp.]|nr:MAG: DUF2169 domain-containing protein [Phycisphaera sp.]
MEIQNLTPMPFAMMHGRLGFPAHSLSLIVRGTFKLVEGKPAEALEEQPAIGGDVLDDQDRLRYEGEFVPFKPKADLLLVGHCHTPSGQALQSCPVLFRVGQTERLLGVFGDRRWQKKMLGLVPIRSDPEPFTTMSITYDRAFGGANSKANPIGIGANSEREHRLPNIEDPHDLIGSPTHSPTPAGFGPLPRDWALRSGKLGTYRKDYLQTRWPWFPEDFDPTYWNAAPPPMQVDYLKGDERVYLQNLVADKPEFDGTLPGLRVRCFVTRKPTEESDEEGSQEVPMHLDTLWVDTDEMVVTLVWRGHTTVTDEEHEEIDHVLIGSEPLAQPPKAEAEWMAASDTQVAAEEAPFVPEQPPAETAPPPEAPSQSGLTEQQAKEIAEQVEEHMAQSGIDVEALAAKPPSFESQVPAMQHAGLDDQTIEELRELLAELSNTSADAAPEASPATIPLAEQLGAHAAKGSSLAGVDLSSQSLPGVKLPAADLSGARLQEADLSGAKMPEAKLPAAQASQAKFTGADLSGADLTGADLSGADLSGANLSGTCLDYADLSRANLADANLSGASAVSAICPEANLDNANMSKANLTSADLADTSCQNTNFRGATMIDACIERANATRSCFCEVLGDRLRANGAVYTQADISLAQLSESQWEGADLSNAKLDGTKFVRGNFAKIKGQDSTWIAADLRGLRFYKAKLVAADLSRSNLMEASLERAIATNAKLDGASLYGADLFETKLNGASHTGTDFSGTSLASGRA